MSVNRFKSGIGVVILGAGASARMGRPKLLLPWRNTSILGHLLDEWNALGAGQVAVVCASDGGPIHVELDRLGVDRANRIINEHPERGMFSSIQTAAAWTGWNPQLTHWVITLGDQPHVQRTTLESLVEFTANHPDRICQPTRNGRGRHPLILPREAFTVLASSTAPDLKTHLASLRVGIAGFESPDAGLDLDIDTPEDYERALRLARR